MKKTVLKFGLFLTLGFTTVVLFSCNKEDNLDDDGSSSASKITATNVTNSSSQIATVKASIRWYDANGDSQDDVIAQAPYKNSGFTLDLPATVAAKHLYLIAELLEGSESFTISDKQAKAIEELHIKGYDANDNSIGYFGFYGTDCDAMWLYVDRNVTIKGESREFEKEYAEEYIKADMDLKKGWNLVYGKPTESYNSSTGITTYYWTMTTQKPSGVNLFWSFESDYSTYGASLKSAKPLSEQKSIFRQ